MVQSGPGLGGGGDKSAVQTGVRTRSGVTSLSQAVVLASSGGSRRTFRSCLKAEKGTLGKEREGFLTFVNSLDFSISKKKFYE